jgi:hypothetical protein
MAIFNEDDAQRRVGFGASITGALGSNAALDLNTTGREEGPATLGGDPQKLELAESLKQTHPDYDAEAPKWQKYLDLYTSNNIYRFLFGHVREEDTSWKRRVERGYYYNYCKNVVDLFTAFLFHAPIDRDPGSENEFFENVYKNADRSGSLWNVFMEQVCTFAQVEGHVGVLVDAPKIPEGGFDSREAEKEAGAFPFLTLLHATQILDWEIDQFGNFLWAKIEVSRPEERTWEESSSTRNRYFQIWTKKDWTEYVLFADGAENVDQQAKRVDGGDHKLGVVPIVIAKMDKHPTHSWFGLSAIKDIADINIGILNWSSLGDEEIFERCLNLLAMERGEGDMPVEITNANVLEYEPGTKTPVYLEPGATPLELILKWITEAKNEIRRLAKLNISTGLGDVRQASSGIAKAFSFVETNQSLAGKALNLEQVETRIHILLLKWIEKGFTGSVSYPREFGIEDPLTLLQEMSEARTTLTSETAIKELEKKLVRKLFARDPMSLRKKIEEEIEEADAMPSMAASFGMVSPISETGSNTETDEDDDPPNQPESAGKATDAKKSGKATAA